MGDNTRMYTYHCHPLWEEITGQLGTDYSFTVLCGGCVLSRSCGLAEEAHNHVENKDTEGHTFDGLPCALLGRRCLLLCTSLL